MTEHAFRVESHSVEGLALNSASVEFPYSHQLNYPSEATLEHLLRVSGEVELQRVDYRTVVVKRLEEPGGLASLRLDGGFFYLTVLAASTADVETHVERISGVIPRSELDSDEINVTFWTLGPQGPEATSRKVIAPQWADIEGNYTLPTRDALEKLLAHELDSTSGGKLVLWHGTPGTGKTYALRSWARAWRDKIDVHYIVDPEVFFGETPLYMVKVLLGDSNTDRWRLIVAEDTGELLAKDAKRATGQALSRLLNVCDGLIGQGLKVLVLVSTNEELGTLHGAVTRPGRCVANVGFEALTAEEATTWLRVRGVDRPRDTSATVAELYSELFDSPPIVTRDPHPVVGFASGRTK